MLQPLLVSMRLCILFGVQAERTRRIPSRNVQRVRRERGDTGFALHALLSIAQVAGAGILWHDPPYVLAKTFVFCLLHIVMFTAALTARDVTTCPPRT